MVLMSLAVKHNVVKVTANISFLGGTFDSSKFRKRMTFRDILVLNLSRETSTLSSLFAVDATWRENLTI